MKRYDIYSECLCGIGFEPSYEESFRGAWVDADIAQELYDALKWSMKYFDQVIAETGYQSEGERIAHRNCKEALEKADKD